VRYLVLSSRAIFSIDLHDVVASSLANSRAKFGTAFQRIDVLRFIDW
jgi:hypothetical protein